MRSNAKRASNKRNLLFIGWISQKMPIDDSLILEGGIDRAQKGPLRKVSATEVRVVPDRGVNPDDVKRIIRKHLNY